MKTLNYVLYVLLGVILTGLLGALGLHDTTPRAPSKDASPVEVTIPVYTDVVRETTAWYNTQGAQ